MITTPTILFFPETATINLILMMTRRQVPSKALVQREQVLFNNVSYALGDIIFDYETAVNPMKKVLMARSFLGAGAANDSAKDTAASPKTSASYSKVSSSRNVCSLKDRILYLVLGTGTGSGPQCQHCQ